MLFLDILAEFLAEDLLYNKIKDYLAIRKGDLKDSAFEKFYKTFVVAFVETHRWPNTQHAEKFFTDETTVDGVLAYLYRFTEPEAVLREKTIVALSRWADECGLGNYSSFTNPQLIERFLTRLETELRRDVNKSLLPYFGDILSGIAKLDEKLEGLSEQFEKYAAEQKARAERVTQIDPSGEQLIVAGKLVYDSTQKIEPRSGGALPVIRCDLEAIDEANHLYRAVISNEAGKELHKHNFTIKPDDAFLLEANHFLEHDGLREYRIQLELKDTGFTRRFGNYFYSLIMGANGALRDKVEDGALETGFQFVLTLDTQAELLWQVPWEYLHDSEEFLGLSGNVHVVRTPKGAGSLRVSAIPQPLKILVVVSNPAGEGEFDSEAALAAIQEALDYSRRMGWVELDYLEEATFAHFRSRLSAFQPHVVHYIGHGGKNLPDAAALQPPYSGKPGETYLAFADDDGEVAPLYGQALKRLLADTPSVQLLVLSGCMTGQTAYSDALAGAGTALLRENLPALVVMQYSVLVDTAIQFAKVFYEAIGRGESLSAGLTHVRQVLAQSRGEHRADWGIPSLYLRLPELQLVDPRAPKRIVETREEAVNIGDLPVVAGFVGRTRELRRLRETVRHPQQPVIYIWGLGGIGKTSLTAKLIEKLEHEGAIEARRVIHCDQIEPTFAAVAEKLGSFISLQGKAGHAEAGLMLQDSRYDIETRVSLLIKAIKERRYLIVFDNFESLFSEKTPQIGRLADASLQEFFMALFSAATAARSTFLFTCRYQWDLLTEESGMNRYRCGLPLANCHLLHLQGLSPAQTRMLMKNLPALGKLTFNQQNQVLPLLLGHPHTIRLFDAYLQQYGLDAVLQDETIIGSDGLDGRGGQPSAPTFIIEKLGDYFLNGLWSRLNEAEKDVLGLLSVFRTSLSEKALAQLITAPQALMTLRNYSLLQHESSEASPSYQVHPVVRGYVESKFGTDKMRGYHLQAVEFYLSRHEDILSRFKEIDMPKPKLLAQLAELAAQRGQTQLAQTLTASLLEMHHHLFVCGEYEQAGELVNAIYYFFTMIGRREVAKVLLRHSIDSLQGSSQYVAKGSLAQLLADEGKWQDALTTFQECVDYFASIGDKGKSNLAVHLGNQAQIYGYRGEYEQALELERRALQIQEEIKNENGLAIRHYRIAQLLRLMKRYDEVLAASEHALVKARAINNPQLESACLHELGLALNELNRPQEAFSRFQESLEITEKIGDRAGLASTFNEMGKLLRQARQFEAAVGFFQRAIEIYYEQQNPTKVAITLEFIGFTFEQQDHFSEALEKYQEALRLAQQYSSPQHIATVENHLARVKGKMKGQ